LVILEGPMSLLTRFLVAAAALGVGVALVALHGGCSRRAAPATATVSGKVTFQGEPLAEGLIVFAPDPDRGGTGQAARGDLGPDGSFQLTIHGETKIPPGWYRVAIAPAPRYERGSVRDRTPFPLELSRPDRSSVVREVKAGQDNRFEFTIEVPGP
jgi:hypothetical protein